MGNRYPITVKAEVLDCGGQIGILVQYGGKREAFRVPNPLWPTIDADWHEDHPKAPRYTGCAGEVAA